MKTVGVYQAKTHFSQLLDRVADGEVVRISRRGRPVARLVPEVVAETAEMAELVARIREAEDAAQARGPCRHAGAIWPGTRTGGWMHC